MMTETSDELAPEARVHRVKRTAGRTLGDKAVVVVIDRDELHTLNASGTFLWESCEGRSVRELGELMGQRYGLDRAQADADVRAFLNEMRRAGAIEVTG